MNHLRYAFAFFVFISIALPAKSELWGCNESSPIISFEYHPHPIELVSNIKDGTGTIKYQGLPEIPTQFIIKGFNRIWIWSDDDILSSEYAFAIKDNYGGYFESFDGDGPSQIYFCHKH